jgi:hypothetical protein
MKDFFSSGGKTKPGANQKRQREDRKRKGAKSVIPPFSLSSFDLFVQKIVLQIRSSKEQSLFSPSLF